MLSIIPRELLQIILSYLDISSKFSLGHTSSLYSEYRILDAPIYNPQKIRTNHMIRMDRINNMDSIIADAITCGHTYLFIWMMSGRKCFPEDYFHKAVKANSFLILKWLNMNGCSWERNTCGSLAAKNGNLDILIWLIENDELHNRPWDLSTRSYVAQSAAKTGHLEIIKYLHVNGGIWNEQHMHDYAAEGGYLYILEWLMENNYSMSWTTWCAAAKNGHLNILNWLLDKSTDHGILLCPDSWKSWSCAIAAGNGYFEIVRWFVEKGCILENHIFSEAAKCGQIDMLKYLLEKGCPTEYQACENAAAYGHFDVLRWLVEIGCRLTSKVCANAARNNDLDMLKWLRTIDEERGACPWDNMTWASADDANGFEMLKWLYDNNCPQIEIPNEQRFSKTMHKAASEGNLEILQWFHQIGYSLDERTSANAAATGNIDLLKWIHENGGRWDVNVCVEAAENGHLHILKYLLTQTPTKNPCPCSAAVCTAAAANGHFEVLQWLRTSDDKKSVCPWSKYTCTKAAKNGHTEILRWLHENGCPCEIKSCKLCDKRNKLEPSQQFKTDILSSILKWFQL